MRIGSPRHLLEIMDELFTARIDHYPMLAIMISQHGIDTVYSILHGGIGTGYSQGNLKQIRVAEEEVLDDLPIGARGRGSALRASGVSMEIYFHWPVCPPLLGTIQELFASLQRVGIGQDYLLQDMHLGGDEVRQHRAEGVHIEIDRPAYRKPTTERDFGHIVRAVESVVGSTDT